jgi:predicted GNAT family acetyltransferase
MKLHLNPNCDPDSLARGIKRNINDGIAFGVFLKGELVSVSDAPAIGPMQDEIEEMGVETSPDYQRRGYGKTVISAMTRAILDIGRVPVCRCGANKEASLRLARAVGYMKYADIIQFRAV